MGKTSGGANFEGRLELGFGHVDFEWSFGHQSGGMQLIGYTALNFMREVRDGNINLRSLAYRWY